MNRILGKISIYGSRMFLEHLRQVVPIMDGAIKQVGTSRKRPAADSWCYASPWYRFHIEALDGELGNFLATHAQLWGVLAVCAGEYEYAVISLCPVGYNEQESFGCLFSHETLELLSRTGLALEIAPASVLPDASFWPTNRQ